METRKSLKMHEDLARLIAEKKSIEESLKMIKKSISDMTENLYNKYSAHGVTTSDGQNLKITLSTRVLVDYRNICLNHIPEKKLQGILPAYQKESSTYQAKFVKKF